MAELAARPRLQWWPSLLGVALATFIAYDLSNGRDLAPVLAASGFVYLATAAVQKRSAAWPLFILTFIVIGFVQSGVASYDPTWVLVALAAPFLIYGIVSGALRQREGLPLQTVAMIAISVLAAIAYVANQALGAYLIAAGLLGHAAWDVWHHRTGKVVAPSMAEFCFVLDTLLAIAILVVTLRA